jgi:hypothetical protein
MKDLLKLFVGVAYTNTILVSGLYIYHDWRDHSNMRRLYALENVPGTEMEKRRLRKAEYDMRIYHELCQSHWNARVFIAPPKIYWSLLPKPEKVEKSISEKN